MFVGLRYEVRFLWLINNYSNYSYYQWLLWYVKGNVFVDVCRSYKYCLYEILFLGMAYEGYQKSKNKKS